MANRIKEIYKYTNSSWGTGTPIGADAENVDVKTGTSTTSDLQTILGVDTSMTPASTSIQGQLNSKVDIVGGNVSSTEITDASDVTKYDLNSSETSTNLISADLSTDTDVVVMGGSGESTATMWSKFNRFRKRVDNKFKNYFANSNLRTSIATSGSDTTVYTTTAINDYLNTVIGYRTTTAPNAGKISTQLYNLNDKMYEKFIYGGYTLMNNGLYGISVRKDVTINNDSTSPSWIKYDSTSGYDNDLIHVNSGGDSGGGMNHKLTGKRVLCFVRYHIVLYNVTSSSSTGSHWFTVVIRSGTNAGGYSTEWNVGTFASPNAGNSYVTIEFSRIFSMKPSIIYGMCMYRSSSYTTGGATYNGSLDLVPLSCWDYSG